MALQVNYNSFVDMNDADDYFETRINADVWFDTATTGHEQALVTASGILDSMVWEGTCTPTDSYPLSWPRDIEYFDPKSGSDIELEDDRDEDTETPGTIPEDIKKATYELALHLLKNAETVEDSENGAYPVKDLTIGSLRLTMKSDNPQSNIVDIPTIVYTYINKYLSTTKTSRGVFVSGGA